MTARQLLRRAERLTDRLMPWLLLVWFLLFSARLLLGQLRGLDVFALAVVAWVLYDWAEHRGRRNERARRAEAWGRALRGSR